MKYVQGNIKLIFDIPKEIKNEEEMFKYIKKIAEELARLDIIKECENPMIIPDFDVSYEPFLNDKEYYTDMYGAIFPK